MEPVNVHIDIETYSEADLKTVGLTAYANHPSTRIELVSWAIDEGDVHTWDFWGEQRDWPVFADLFWQTSHDPAPPEALVALLRDPNVICKAFNAPFEKTLLEACWGVSVPYERWECVMVKSYMLGFSGGLADVGAQIGLPQNKAKLKEGRDLVLKFCKPAPRTHKADRYGPWNAPEKWAQYLTYNAQDVVAEREIDLFLKPYQTPERERKLWLLDRKINERGLPIDTQLVAHAVELDAETKAHIKQQMNQITGLKNANSTQQLLPWVKFHGVDMPNMRAATVDRYLEKDLPNDVRTVLNMRRQVSQTSTKKYKALLEATYNGRLTNSFQFAGAQRTQRWAGRIFQPHNIKRGYKDADIRANLIANGARRELVEMIEGDVIEFLSNVIRASVTAPPNKMLVVNDYGSIESRFLGWLSACPAINNCFAAGRDTYTEFGVQYYGIPYEEITKEMRFFCKPPVLGCGYQLGPDTLIEYGRGMGVTITMEQSVQLVDLWRRLHPEVVDMWGWLIETCKRVVQDGQPRSGYGCWFYRDTNFLFIWLPSQRFIAYYQPAVVMRAPPWEIKKQQERAAHGEDYNPRTIPTLTYMGRNQYTNKWDRLSTHGGKITENIIQGVSRDLLGDDMMEMDALGFDLIGHVHDEVLDEAEEDRAEDDLAIMQGIMSTTPDWAPGLLLDSEGFISKRYKKG